ncbi:MAG: hypothetical protein ACRDHU_12200, partial [Actinomycetota bacterium]
MIEPRLASKVVLVRGLGLGGVRTVVLGIVLALGPTACSSEGSDSELCEDLRSFQATLQAATTTQVTSQGAEAVADQLELARGTLETMRETAGEAFEADLAAIDSALGDVAALVDEVQAGT